MKQAYLTIINMDRAELTKEIGKLFVYGLMVFLSLFYFSERYIVGIDDQKDTSLDYRIFLVDTHSEDVDKGDFVAFDSLHPISNKEMMVTKQVVGVSGDIVSFNKLGDVFINKKKIKTISPVVLEKLGVELDTLLSKYTIKKDHIFVVGTHHRSYDSSYHGTLNINKIKGVTYPLFNYEIN